MIQPKVKLPKIEYSDFLWIIVCLIGLYFAGLTIAEWQRNKLFKITQDRLTMAYETQVYKANVAEAYEALREANDGTIHDATRVQSPMDDEPGTRESSYPEVNPDTQSGGAVPYRIGGSRSLANLDENAEGVE
jgi:hypothetical protein